MIVGYGDIYPKSTIGRGLIILIFMFGQYLISMLIAAFQ